MRKALFIFALAATAAFAVNGQTLSAKARNYLTRHYPGWQVSKVCSPDLNGHAVIAGDFNGDRRTDYAVAISKGSRSYLIALLATESSFDAVNLQAVDRGAGNVPLVDISLAPKGTEIARNIETKYHGSYRVNLDSIVVSDCGGELKTFFWHEGKFVIVEDDLIEKSPQEKYIGLRYLSGQGPKELEDIGFFIVGKTDEDLASGPSLSVSMWRPAGSKSSNPTMFWLETAVEASDANRSMVEVLDVLKIPSLRRTEAFGKYCNLNGRSDPEIFVIAAVEKDRFVIVRAWRANTTDRLFEDISTDGIECPEELFAEP